MPTIIRLIPIKPTRGTRVRTGLFPYAPPKARVIRSVATPITGVVVVGPQPTLLGAPQAPRPPSPSPSPSPSHAARASRVNMPSVFMGVTYIGGIPSIMEIPLIARRPLYLRIW